ncbi:poly(beta-D-mannuronate) lyase [Granulicella sp. 5B5]|uniref:alginate lyase family protein n=1 Tax=Granulicella sp. 5B5 TaxID=1617967 RepID=UPI0015F3A2BF|nr:alginate lyase family protein [Granulicella sp. 5B5]QMV18303.1 poly(beta-D-mannuronate) lyase [Granulicella sp. 5B5]
MARLYASLALSLSVALFNLVPAASAAMPNPLRSPWSGHPVTATSAPYTCAPLTHVTPDLTTDGFYRLDDPTHSIIDPVREAAYRASADPVKAVGQAIVSSADDYRTTGSQQALHCTVARILTLAHDNSLAGKMSSSQAYYVQGWVAGAVAIAYLKVHDDAHITPEQNQLVGDWLVSVGAQTIRYYDDRKKPGKGDAQNNHLYWAGVEIAAIGVAANNRKDFDWAMAAYDNGVNQIRPDGTLPLEMERGQRALHYHLYALAPLVLIAEFGEANGLDLYAHANGAIHRLVDVSITGLKDPKLFVKATGIKQEVPRVVTGDQIGWAPPYVRRFPNPSLEQLIHKAPSLSVYYLGGLPPQ